MTDETIPEPDRIQDAPHPRETMTLIGQTKAEVSFLDAYNSGRLHHAWIISGPRGVGKATLAWRIARFLLTTETAGMSGPPLDISSSRDHPVTRRILALSEPGIFVCRRGWDEKKKRLKTVVTVDEVRKLKSFFNLSAADGGWRIAIVDTADELNGNAANALLKILEEPPAHTILLLVSHQPAKLLPTIRSRCRMLRCDPLEQSDLENVLTNSGFETTAPKALAELSLGSPGDAIRLITNDGIAIYQQIVDILAKAPQLSRPALISLGDRCVGRLHEERYATVVDLIELVLVRLARHGAGQSMAEAANGEKSVFQKLSINEAQSRIWAGLQQELTGRITHARGVNLDPAQVILDTFLRIESAALRALR